MTERSFLAELSLKTIPVDASIGFPVACVEITVAGCVCVCSFTFHKQKHNLSSHESLFFFTHHIVLLPLAHSPPYRRLWGKWSILSVLSTNSTRLWIESQSVFGANQVFIKITLLEVVGYDDWNKGMK